VRGYSDSFLLYYFVNFEDNVVHGKGNIIKLNYRLWGYWVGLKVALQLRIPLLMSVYFASSDSEITKNESIAFANGMDKISVCSSAQKETC
jgi:hypothetical protein